MEADLVDAIAEQRLKGQWLWASHLMWSELLRWWCEKNNKNRLHVIPFDKLCLLSGLVWNRMADRELVSWRVPYVASPGIHGHGPMLPVDPKKCKPPFVLDFLKIEYLALPFLARDVYELHPIPETKDSEVNEIRSTLGEGQIENWVGNGRTFTPEEANKIRALGTFISSLTSEEIRALGVHAGQKMTLEALEYNVSYWCRIFNEVVSKQLTGDGKQAAHTFEELRNELERKAGLHEDKRRNHRELYERGRRKIECFKDKEIRGVLLDDVCPPMAEIWEHKTVVEWTEKVRTLSALTEYVMGFGAARRALGQVDGSETETDSKRRAAGEAARLRLVAQGYSLPTYPDAVEKFSEEATRVALTKFFDELPTRGFPDHWEVFGRATH